MNKPIIRCGLVRIVEHAVTGKHRYICTKDGHTCKAYQQTNQRCGTILLQLNGVDKLLYTSNKLRVEVQYSNPFRDIMSSYFKQFGITTSDLIKATKLMFKEEDE